jgi:hypothetical protein
MATQLKAFALLLAILMIGDGLAFGGHYRRESVIGLAHFFGAATSHWNVGHGRDWSAPPRPKRS